MTMVGVVAELTTMAGEVDALAGEVEALGAPAMASTMRAIGSLVAAAQRLEVRAAAHFTRLGAFRAAGAASTAAWLRTQRGLSGGAAKQIEDAARAIAAVGVVRDAVERGAMSVAHAALVAGLCDQVRLGDLAEAELVPLVDKAAELPVDRFRQEVRSLEARLDAVAGRDPARGNSVRSHDGDAGRKAWRAELDAESHQIVGNAMDALVDEAWRAGHPKDAPARGTPEVTVLIDWETLRDEILRDDSVCRLVDGTPLSPATVRRIACAANVIPAVLGGNGDVLDLGTTQRLASAGQHRALAIQHDTCAWPGRCDVPVHWCTAHHLQPWTPVSPGAARGPTDLANLAPLCSAHHHLAHEGGWTLTRAPTAPSPHDPPATHHRTANRPTTHHPTGSRRPTTNAVPTNAKPSHERAALRVSGSRGRATPRRSAGARGARRSR